MSIKITMLGPYLVTRKYVAVMNFLKWISGPKKL